MVSTMATTACCMVWRTIILAGMVLICPMKFFLACIGGNDNGITYAPKYDVAFSFHLALVANHANNKTTTIMSCLHYVMWLLCVNGLPHKRIVIANYMSTCHQQLCSCPSRKTYPIVFVHIKHSNCHPPMPPLLIVQHVLCYGCHYVCLRWCCNT